MQYIKGITKPNTEVWMYRNKISNIYFPAEHLKFMEFHKKFPYFGQILQKKTWNWLNFRGLALHNNIPQMPYLWAILKQVQFSQYRPALNNRWAGYLVDWSIWFRRGNTYKPKQLWSDFKRLPQWMEGVRCIAPR